MFSVELSSFDRTYVRPGHNNSKRQNMVVFHKDPCGVICLLMTYSLVLYADYCFVQHVVIPTLTDRLVHFLLGPGKKFLVIFLFLVRTLNDRSFLQSNP